MVPPRLKLVSSHPGDAESRLETAPQAVPDDTGVPVEALAAAMAVASVRAPGRALAPDTAAATAAAPIASAAG